MIVVGVDEIGLYLASPALVAVTMHVPGPHAKR